MRTRAAIAADLDDARRQLMALARNPHATEYTRRAQSRVVFALEREMSEALDEDDTPDVDTDTHTATALGF